MVNACVSFPRVPVLEGPSRDQCGTFLAGQPRLADDVTMQRVGVVDKVGAVHLVVANVAAQLLRKGDAKVVLCVSLG